MKGVVKCDFRTEIGDNSLRSAELGSEKFPCINRKRVGNDVEIDRSQISICVVPSVDTDSSVIPRRYKRTKIFVVSCFGIFDQFQTRSVDHKCSFTMS